MRIPSNKMGTDAPKFSIIDLIKDPCFPIKCIACVDVTNKRTEENALPAF